MADITMLNNVKTRLGQLGYTVQDTDDPALYFMIEKTRNEILNFCNIDALPRGIMHIFIDKICGQFLQDRLLSGKLTGYDFTDGIKSISEGDVSFTFSDADSDETKFNKLILWLINHGDDQLISYRKMRW